jgi:acyl carrier protein
LEAIIDTQTKLLDLIGKVLAKKDVRPEHKLREDLGADSLDMLELAMAVEENFNVEVPDETAAGFNTVQDIVFFLDQYGRNR